MTMTETAFAPGQAGSETETGSGGATSPVRNKKLLLIVGGATLLVLGLLAAFLLMSGGSGDAPQSAAPSLPRPATGAGTAAKPSTAPGAVTPAVVHVRKHDFRDPFKVLLQAAAVPNAGTGATGTGTTGTGTTTTTGTGTTGTGTTTTTGTGTTGTGTTTTTGTGTTQPQPSTSHKLQIMSVAADNSTITIKVDGRSHPRLKAGEVFATYFKVIGIGGQVNVVQYGDVKFSISGTKAVTIAS